MKKQHDFSRGVRGLMPSSCPNCSKCLLAIAIRCSECGWKLVGAHDRGSHQRTMLGVQT